MKNKKCPDRKTCFGYMDNSCEGCGIGDEITRLHKKIDRLKKQNEKLRTKGEWISVTERLPQDERVLVYLKEKLGNYTRIDTDRRVNEKWVRWEGSVTHWMPLPKLPEEVDAYGK